jgi:methylated-DNA-protein-cysteine methyltransferase-like protein
MATRTDYELAIRQTIGSIPRGKVATYGQIAEAAGYPNYHRQVAQVLRKYGDSLPWHRVLGAGGSIRTGAPYSLEQRLRLQVEGVRFRGAKVDLARSGARFPGREAD